MTGRFTTPKAEGQSKPRSFDDFDLRLGDIMRGERATLGKSLLDVQRELKIKAAYIAAIENADPDAFETQGFVAGYVRSYARYLGLDPEWAYGKFCHEGHFAVAHGMSAAAAPARPPRAQIAAQDSGRDLFTDPSLPYAPKGERLFSHVEPGALGSIAVLLVLIAGLGYGGWSILQEVQRVRFAPVDQAPGVVADMGSLDDSAAEVAADTDSAGLASAPSPDALDRLYRPQALDVPVLVARDGPIASIDPKTSGTLPAEGDAGTQMAQSGDPLGTPALVQTPGQGATAADQTQVADAGPAAQPGAPQVVAGDPPAVVMFAVRPSWVRVKAADGTVLFEKILDSGEEYVLPKTEQPPTLRAGNAGSLYFTINGKTYGPAGKGPSVIKNVALSANTLTESYPVADLGADKALADYVAVAQAGASATQAMQRPPVE